MSKLKQLIGLQTSNLSVRELARALGLSIGAVSKYQRAVRAAGIGAAEAENLPGNLWRRALGDAETSVTRMDDSTRLGSNSGRKAS